MMRMKFQEILLVIVSISNVIWCSPTPSQIVNLRNPSCEDQGDAIFCDFKDQMEPVYMEEPPEYAQINRVYIYNAKKLYLSDKACVNVTISNIREASVNKSIDGECGGKFAISATRSTFTSIHSRVNQLILHECNVTNLRLDSNMDKLDIIKSDIKELNITGEFVSGATVILKESKVAIIEKLSINSRSQLIIEKSHINNINYLDLDISNGRVSFKASSIQELEVGDFVLEYFQGTFSMKRSQQSKNLCVDQQGYTYDLMFYVCLLLLIASWIYIVYLKKDDLCKCIPSRSARSAQAKINPESKSDSAIIPMLNENNDNVEKQNLSNTFGTNAKVEVFTKEKSEEAINVRESNVEAQNLILDNNIKQKEISNNLQELCKISEALLFTIKTRQDASTFVKEILRREWNSEHPAEMSEGIRRIIGDNSASLKCLLAQEREVVELSKTTKSLVSQSHPYLVKYFSKVESVCEQYHSITICDNVTKLLEEEKTSKIECTEENQAFFDELEMFNHQYLQHSVILINGSIQLEEKCLLLLLDIQISYLKFLLDTYQNEKQ